MHYFEKKIEVMNQNIILDTRVLRITLQASSKLKKNFDIESKAFFIPEMQKIFKLSWIPEMHWYEFFIR